MIDVETYIFNSAYDAVAPLCAKGGYRSVPTPRPTVFPTVTLFEMGNRTDAGRKTALPTEDYAILTYEAHVYANSRKECREVFSALDDELMKLNMIRISGDYSPSTVNTKVQEYVARYRVEVDREGMLYRRS